MSDRILSNIISILNTPLWPKNNNKKSPKSILSLINKPLKSPTILKKDSADLKKIQDKNNPISDDTELNLESLEIISSLESLEKLKSNHNLYEYSEQQRYYFLEMYQKLRSLALHSADIVNNPDWEIDNWEIDVKIVLILLTNSPNYDEEEIQNILWLSPQVRRLKLSLSEDDYDLKAFEYVDRVYQWAKKLQQSPIG